MFNEPARIVVVMPDACGGFVQRDSREPFAADLDCGVPYEVVDFSAKLAVTDPVDNLKQTAIQEVSFVVGD